MAEPAAGFAGLDPCVHCGFCLPACPTYLATGDENDSPRGRIVLMRALERGEIPATDPALRGHLDACLGCRGCEPACPSGVEYGHGLEAARALLARARRPPLPTRLALALFRRKALWRPAFRAAAWLTRTGLPRRLAGSGRIGFGLGMLAASAPSGAAPSAAAASARGSDGGSRPRGGPAPAEGSPAGTPDAAWLFPGCVMDTLFAHVNRATARTLEANGYAVRPASRAVCCGALHAHAGDLDGARALARANVLAVPGDEAPVVVNSAGCGAMLKEYGRLLDDEPARRFAARVRDVAEVLAARGPRRGGDLPLRIAYDPPCHLQHAQGVHAEVLAVLAAVPGLEVEQAPGADRCCGSAGLFTLTQPAMSRAVLEEKLASLPADAAPELVVTGNPGCLMQIGAGLLARGDRRRTAHPVEVLDWSYRAAGYYGGGG